MSWPTDTLSKTDYDQGTDDPSLARAQLAALHDKVKELLAQTITDYALTLLDDNSASAARATLGLGTAAVKSTGTDGDYVPLLSGANVWRANQTIRNADGQMTHFGLIGSNSHTQVVMYRHNGAEAAPTAVLNGDVISHLWSMGWNGSAYAAGGLIRVVAAQNWTATANGCRLELWAAANDQMYGLKAYLQDGVVVGNPAGGDLGYGRINATEYYRNGVSLTTLLAANAGIGTNQTMRNVTGSRALGVAYTNTTGRPIEVHVSLNTGAINYSGGFLYVNGLEVEGSTTIANSVVTLRSIIPHGSTYQVNGAGAGVLRAWHELR